MAVWTAEQTGAFLDHAAADRLYALYHRVAFRGLRRGEAVGLPWVDVDLDGALLTVSQQIVQVGWATEEEAPKTSSGVRSVALDAETVAVLRAQRILQSAERLRCGPAWTDTGLVFTREDGRAVHPDFVTRHFERLVRAADLPPIRLHDLRHGAATSRSPEGPTSRSSRRCSATRASRSRPTPTRVSCRRSHAPPRKPQSPSCRALRAPTTSAPHLSRFGTRTTGQFR